MKAMDLLNFICCIDKESGMRKKRPIFGWERKRGLLNQFNEYLLKKEQADFTLNTIEESSNQDDYNIKYIITIDSDTELVLNTGIELISSMAHILNTPILNKTEDAVIDGYGIMQPRVSVHIESSRKSLFTKIFAGSGGLDSYSNAISDVYQDNFGEGIFTGKGIYDLTIFSKVLSKEIPENTVLSHDLLEGSYLRCGLCSDILLLDGYPYKYAAFMSRQHRWIRGDFQIIGWLKKRIVNKEGKKKKNPLGALSKFKIFDNLRRSLLEISILFSFLLLLLLNAAAMTKITGAVIFLSMLGMIPTIIEILNLIIFRDERVKKQKSCAPEIAGVLGSILRGILAIASLPHKAYIAANAILRTIYRLKFSKQNMLEWVTAEEGERLAKTTISSYYTAMFPNVIFSILMLLYSTQAPSLTARIASVILALIWTIAPIIFCYSSKELLKKAKIEEVKKEDREYLLGIGKKTWQYFKENLNEKTNFLPPDNYQEDRLEKLAYRTSSTNIGLGLLAVISAYDLKYETLKFTNELLEKMLNTMCRLSKWNGHLFNWYDIKTLEPLMPRYISTVDNGNLVGYLYVCKAFLESEQEESEKIQNMIKMIEDLIQNMDFSLLYNKTLKLFSIGFHVEENKLTDSYYDLLASEARSASLIAIAKKDVPAKHFASLGRTMTVMNRYKGLISWSGTAFEYLMPHIHIKKYEGSLIDESCKFMILSQKWYSEKLGIPWGISESAYNLKDFNSNYQYKAFGVPWLGLKRGLEDDLVVAPYGSILAIPDIPNEVIQNMKRLEKEGALGKYGFYESIDYTLARLGISQSKAVVKTFMAHHQGLILLSLNNLFCNNILQKRFEQNPEIKAVDVLLQEKMPERMIITGIKKELPERQEPIRRGSILGHTVYQHKFNAARTQCHVIANEEYAVVMNQKGEGYSKFGDVFINRFKVTDDEPQGIFFFMKNIKTKRIWTSQYMNCLGSPDQYHSTYMDNSIEMKRQDGNIKTITKIAIAPNEETEIRSLELSNEGLEEEIIEITTALEPVLLEAKMDYAHRAFSNLFLTYEVDAHTNTILVKRKKRELEEEELYLGVSFYTEDETIGELEYEIDKEKFYGRDNLDIPIMVKESKPFSKQINMTIDPIVAFKRVMKIPNTKKVNIALILSVGKNKDTVLKNIAKYQNAENIARMFELSCIRAQEETRYLGLSGERIETYQMMLPYFVYPSKKITSVQTYRQSELFKFGISGNLPILMTKIKDINDFYVIEEVIAAYEFFRLKSIKIDLIIIDEEDAVYEQYVKSAIQTFLFQKHLESLKNITGGIFVFGSKELKPEDLGLLEFKANLILDAFKGEIGGQIKHMEEVRLEQIQNIGYDDVSKTINIEEVNRTNLLDKKDTAENLKYYNEYGAFSKDGKEYFIKINKDQTLPTTWSHIMANEQFGTVVTEGMGGYTWSGNSRLNRISSWNNNPVLDIPSEIIYLKEEDTRKTWSVRKKTDAG